MGEGKVHKPKKENVSEFYADGILNNFLKKCLHFVEQYANILETNQIHPQV